ncbi:ABC transporter ATP-binding protein [Defluviicoccus vanus]|uniref:ABC transporter ATP-binding protein n=1 Tax=Defluviicoccus vanus TaxID=111831 RepID=UPI001CBA64BA|nr:ABC transporter ATP-binding protein [Defluviicoccus vanus]
MAALLTLQQVDKRFATGNLALSGINIRVNAGEFLSLIGPSGCGKSTLLRLVAGLTQATGGQLGRDPALDASGGIGYVFQEPTLLPWATVANNVWLPLRLAGLPRAAAADRVAETLSMVGLDSVAAARPPQLSGGMRMRVSIARALVTRPRLLLLDEPFAALDEITRMRLTDDLHHLWRRAQLTVMFVTHNVFEACYLSTR